MERRRNNLTKDYEKVITKLGISNFILRIGYVSHVLRIYHVPIVELSLEGTLITASECLVLATIPQISTLQRLKEIQTELETKIQEVDKLGGDVKDLQKAKAEVDAQLKRSVSRSTKAIKELKDRVEGYEELLKLKDDEIERLKTTNQSL